jgi:hypothetical protein
MLALIFSLGVLQAALIPSTLSRHAQVVRLGTPMMQSAMGGAGEGDAEMGNTYWTTWAEEEGITSEGAFPPGEDVVEDDLKRMFSLDATDGGSISATEIDDMQVCSEGGGSLHP